MALLADRLHFTPLSLRGRVGGGGHGHGRVHFRKTMGRHFTGKFLTIPVPDAFNDIVSSLSQNHLSELFGRHPPEFCESSAHGGLASPQNAIEVNDPQDYGKGGARESRPISSNVRSSPFRVPVDPVRDDTPTYFLVIANPMNLTKVKRKLTDGSYQTPADFVEDFRLICDNAVKYHGETSVLGCIAMDLRAWMETQYRNKASSSDDERHRRLTDVVNRLRRPRSVHSRRRAAPGSFFSRNGHG
jgi:hypothetical protein